MKIELVEFKADKIVTNSKAVADYFGKENRNVMRDIRKIISISGDFGALNFERSYYISLQSKKLECFDMTRDGFSVLAMGFSGERALEFKINYLNQFNAMEQHIKDQYSLTEKVNEASLRYGQGKEKASDAGRTLSQWKKEKEDGEKELSRLINKSQLFLDIFR